MASSSKSSDVFRPRLPVDPYTYERPWLVPSAAVENMLSEKEPSKQVVLVLGEPPSQELFQLLQSPLFSDSVFLLVTHKPPQLPNPSQLTPYVYILRTLNPPSSSEVASAVYLVNVLDRAQRIVHDIRRTPPTEKLTQLCESAPGSDFTVRENARASSRLSLVSKFGKGAASSSSHARLSPSSTRPFDAVLNFVSPSLEESTVLKQVIVITTMSQPYVTSNGMSDNSLYPPMPATPRSRPGSVYSNSMSSKERLPPSPNTWTKRTSMSFLKGAGLAAQSAPNTPYNLSRESLFSAAQSAGSRAHVVHILPPNHHLRPKSPQAHLSPHSPSRGRHSSYGAPDKTKLVRGIEQFLLSFAFPGYKAGRSRHGSTSSSRPSSLYSMQSDRSSLSDAPRNLVPNSKRASDSQKAHQYLVASNVLSHVPQETTLTVGEMLLRGGLDAVETPSTPPYEGSRAPSLEQLGQFDSIPRVWIARGALVQVGEEEKSTDYILEEDLAPTHPIPSTSSQGVTSPSHDSTFSSRRGASRKSSLPTPPLSSDSSDEQTSRSNSTDGDEPTITPTSHSRSASKPSVYAPAPGQQVVAKKPSRWKFWRRIAT